MTKKKLITKVVAFATAAMMLVGMAIPAMAGTNPNTGDITVHKYAGLVGSSVANNTGTELNTGDANHPLNNNYTALGGAGFTLYKVDDLTAVMAKLKAGATITSTVVVPGTEPEVKYTFSDSTTLTEETTVVGAEETTTAAGIAKFGDNSLADGVYVLVETTTPTGYNTAAPSIIRLPLTDAAGKANYNVHVYPKNISDVDVVNKDVVGVTKPIEKDDIIAFELKAKFLSDTVNNVDDLRDGTDYGIARITETFNTYFTYQSSPGVKVYWLDSAGEIDTTAPIATSDYEITAVPTGAGGSFSVTLKPAAIDIAIGTSSATDNKVGFGITVSAKYTGGASAAQGGTPSRAENTMSALILEANGDPTTPPVDNKTYAPAIAIKVAKTKSDDSALANVTFALAKTATPAINLEANKMSPSDYGADAATVTANYYIGADGNILMAKTDTSGFLVFSNLTGYNDTNGATFYLKEVETATGFQLKSSTIEVKFQKKSDYATAHPTWVDGSGNWTENANILETANIKNYRLDEKDPTEPGFSLPLTGGAGTIAFTVAGIVLMLGAALLIVRKRKEA